MKTKILMVLAAGILAGCGGSSAYTGEDSCASGNSIACLTNSLVDGGQATDTGTDQKNPETDAAGDTGSDTLVETDVDAGDAGTEDALAEVGTDAGQDAADDTQPTDDGGTDALAQVDADAGETDAQDAGTGDALAQVDVDAGQDAADDTDALVDAGAGDAMDEWDGYIPVCIDGVKDCQGKQPVICQGGQWVNNGAPCAWKCGQSAVEPNVCFDSGRHTSAGPNGVNSDPITLDNATGLKWAGFSTPGDYAQQSVACTNMNPTWTTPTLAQLQTLLTQPFPVAAGVTQNNVDGMASGFSGWIWSSTKFDSGHGWGMNMETGAAELHYLYETSLNFGLLCLVP